MAACSTFPRAGSCWPGRRRPDPPREGRRPELDGGGESGPQDLLAGRLGARANIAAARAGLQTERATEEYAKRRASDLKRREAAQVAYVGDFEAEVRAFLRFAPAWAAVERALAQAVTAHATPVGSGTVARTKRIEIDRRAEAAVIAWLRHQTTAYDSMRVARVKGARREVRRELAELSRCLLDLHRRDAPHATPGCPLCAAVGARPGATCSA